MGRAIYYCVQCSQRVADSDLECGKASRVGDRILCSKCDPESAKKHMSSKKVPAVNRPRNSSTATGLKPVSAPLAPPPAPPPPDRKKLYLLGGAGAAGLVIVIILVIVLVRGKSGGSGKQAGTPSTPSTDTDKAPPTKTDVGDPKEAAAKADLEKARGFGTLHPEDLSGRLKEFTELVWKWEGTEGGREAAREAAAVKALILDQVGKWIAEVEAQIKDLVDAKDFGAASRKVEGLKSTHDLPEWKLAAEKLASELFVKAKKLAEEEAAKTVPGGKPATGEDKPAAKALSEEAKGYLAKWQAATALATARDYASAIAELDRSVPALKENEVKAEAEDDAALLRRIAAVVKESTDYLRQRPRGSGLALSHRDSAGAVKRAGGAILQIDAERVEILAGKGTVFVDWADVTTTSLAEIAQRGKFDPRALAGLCLLEGDVETARSFQAELPPKWWAYAEGARARIPKPDAGERSARDLYAAAEKGYRSMETRAAAIESYRSLRADYTATSLVKSYSERISRRSEAGKEYYVPPSGFSAEGTFRLAKSGRLESIKDSDDRDTILNIAELEFAVLPNQTYRCWILVGACCEETFLFFYQGSELTDTDPKTKKKIAVEPGSNFAIPVKHSIRNLKKTHDDHKPKGAKVHPKTAARWEWVEVVLPKYAGPGGKKLRFMTNQAGFSIGGAIVTATRKAPPPEAELKDLEKAQALDEPSLPIDPDLVGWWSFDEGAGAAVIDLTGKGHAGKLVGDAKWAEGKIGGALQTAGGSSGVEVADAEDLRIPGDLTMALWVRKTVEPGDWVCIFGRGTREQRNYGLWLEAKTQRFMYQQYNPTTPGSDINVYCTKVVETGKWSHLAVTIEQDLVKVFLNGEPSGQGRRPGRSWAGAAPLGLGYAMHHSALTGQIDDVRLYRRALNPEEIRSLFEMGK